MSVMCNNACCVEDLNVPYFREIRMAKPMNGQDIERKYLRANCYLLPTQRPCQAW